MTQPIIHDEKRAAQIAAIRELANWLDANPHVPMPGLALSKHLQNSDEVDGALTQTENLALVRDLATQLGDEADEVLNDRTVLRHRINQYVTYQLFAWHRGGRNEASELEHLRARVAELESANARKDERATDDNSRAVHYLEPGAAGENTDRVACGALVIDVANNLTTATTRITCTNCSDKVPF